MLPPCRLCYVTIAFAAAGAAFHYAALREAASLPGCCFRAFLPLTPLFFSLLFRLRRHRLLRCLLRHAYYYFAIRHLILR